MVRYFVSFLGVIFLFFGFSNLAGRFSGNLTADLMEKNERATTNGESANGLHGQIHRPKI